MKTTVIHHSADFDGLFCREIARKFLPDAELIGWDFADKPLLFDQISEPRGDIYVLDLPVDKIFGFDFRTSTDRMKVDFERFIWIDHHKSSIETHPTDISGYCIDGVAACRLAWQYFTLFHPTAGSFALPKKEDYIERRVTEPLAVRLAGEYDIWDKRDPRAELFQHGLRSQELSENLWDIMLVPEQRTDTQVDVGTVAVEALLDAGKAVQYANQKADAGMVTHRSFLVEFEGLKFLALNTARCNSLTFDAKDIPETGHDALMGFYLKDGQWNFSLYHAKHRTDLDLSQIAVKHSGGGHRGACGFRTNTLPF